MNAMGPVSLGDIARVIKTLRPQDARTWNHVFQVLGLPLEVEERSSADMRDPPDKQVSGDRKSDEKGAPPLPLPRALPVFAPGSEIDLRQVESAVANPDWSEALNVMAAASEGASVMLDPPPLFAPGQGRALLTAAAIALAETGELDEDRAIEQIARGEPLSEIPLRLRPTSRFGVQLLVDRGPRLQPFRQDQKRLLADLCQTVGTHRVEVLRFAGFPNFAGPGTRRTWRPYEYPAAGTVVLVVTDLGLGWLGEMEPTHDFEDWVLWARTLRSAGVRPVALVPHGPRNWPEVLQHHLTLVHWDRSTTVGTIRSAGALSPAGRQ